MDPSKEAVIAGEWVQAIFTTAASDCIVWPSSRRICVRRAIA